MNGSIMPLSFDGGKIMARPRTYQTLSDAFWAHIESGEPDECWLWRGPKLPAGYGKILFHKKHLLAHRVAYALHLEDPGEMLVCHRCDVPACVNPAHLFLGTHTDNNKDAAQKGRFSTPARFAARARQINPSGDQHWTKRHPEWRWKMGHHHSNEKRRSDSRFSDEEITQLLADIDAGATLASKARQYGINPTTMLRLVRRERIRRT